MAYVPILTTAPPNPWPVMTLAARSGTWATYTGRLWMDATRLANLRAHWVSGDPNFVSLKSNWGIFGTTSHLVMAYVLDYAATGNTANVLAAYNFAVAQEFVPFPPSGNAWDFQIDDVTLYIPYAAYVLDWMWPALSAPQRAALAARLEHFAGYIEGNLNTPGVYLPTRNMGNWGLMACIIAGNGESGFANRLTEARNFAQNQQIFIDEAFSDGGTMGYQVGESWALFPIIMYLTASGELNLINSRCQKIANKGKHLARTVMANGYDYWTNPANLRMGVTGKIILDPDFVAWEASVFAGATKDPLIKQIWAGQMTSPGGWARNFPYTTGSWLAFLYHDDALAQAAQSTLPLSAFFPKSGTHNIRGGWNVASDVNVWFHVGPSFGPMHDDVKAGDIQILRGETQLIVPGRTYPGRNTGWNSWPPGGSLPGNNSITCSCMAFEGADTTNMHGDFSGGQPIYAPDPIAFPKIDSFSNGQATPCSSARVISSTDDGTLTKIVADLSKSYPQVTSLQTTFGMRREGTGKATIVIYEQFVAPVSIDHIRRNFWGPPGIKPTLDNESVIQGTTNAGYLTSNSNKVVIVNGTSQATIQCASVVQRIDLVGGPGFESVYNLAANNPITKAGNNQGDLSADAIARMTGIWRTSPVTSNNVANGEMIVVITVDAQGTTAPTYTRAQALAILGAVVPPPDTQAPTVPTNLIGHVITSTEIDLTWSASTDNVGVTGYKLYRNAGLISTQAGLSFADTGLTPMTTYTYTVQAFDAANNLSALSIPAVVTTDAAPDTQAPTVPINLAGIAASSTQIDLTWTASTDNVSVTGYHVRRNGSVVGTVINPLFSDTGLQPTTTYAYTVDAFDAAGNISAQSSVASVLTPTGPSPPPPPPPPPPVPMPPGSFAITATPELVQIVLPSGMIRYVRQK